MKLSVTYDQKRSGYFISGHGFDFFAYFTEGGPNGGSYIECDNVVRQGDPYSLHLIIPLSGAQMLSTDLLETLICKELAEYWNI